VSATLVPQWNRAMMVSGVFVKPDFLKWAMQEQPDKSLRQITDEYYELLYYEEGADSTVAVRRRRGDANSQRTLVIDGKADASSAGDMPTQILLAQLPMTLRPQADNALVIGLGSGITAGSLSAINSLKDITILEISDEVIEASAFFEPENRNVLEDPRVRLVTADARNYLMAASDTYDLIVSEPSNPWISGIANLFTDEFLKLAKSRLTPEGVMTQWFHIYSMSDSDLRTMLKTFDDNFEYVSVWRIQAGDLALIGSDRPHALSLRYAAEEGASELARAKIRSDRDLAGLYIIGGERLSQYVQGAQTNSDLAPIVEFSAPRNLYASTATPNMASIFAFLRGRAQAVPMTDMVLKIEDLLHAPYMSLNISMHEPEATQINAQWQIDRPQVRVNGASISGLGSERLLSWTEGHARVQIRAVLQTANETTPTLMELLGRLTLETGRPGGTTNLADGTTAIWLIAAKGGRAPLQLDVAWDCPAEAGQSSRYGLHASLPDPGPASRQAVLDKLLGRISCSPTDQPAMP
jgi:spermidine synthase